MGHDTTSLPSWATAVRLVRLSSEIHYPADPGTSRKQHYITTLVRYDWDASFVLDLTNQVNRTETFGFKHRSDRSVHYDLRERAVGDCRGKTQ